MFQELVLSLKDAVGIQTPGRISGASVDTDSTPAIETLSASFKPIIPGVGGGIGRVTMPVNPVIGYRFDCTEPGEHRSGILSPEIYQRVVAELQRQEEEYGRVIELPSEMGGSGESVVIPSPDLDTLPE